jgi:hypothetical protein
LTIGDTLAKDGDRVGQPIHSKTCCCHSHVIGNNLVGISDGKVDCALAKYDGSRSINLVITNNATSEILRVKDKDEPIVGVPVKKIGARSGFTIGVVVDIGVVTTTEQQIPLPDGTTVRQRKDQVIVRPDATETYQLENGKVGFSNHGDSGSVILDVDGDIVALLHGAVRDMEHLTLANPIDNVLAAFEAKGHKIKLAVSPPGGGSSEMLLFREAKRSGFVADEFPLLEQVAKTEMGRRLYPLIREHRAEIMNLINHCRPVTVTWRRSQGPAFLAHLLNSSREPGYKIPREVEGVSRQTLLLKREPS